MFELFITYFYIGLTTFGGGYSMIPHIKDIIVDKKNWITDAELLEILAISEATPGPVAINMATFIGYKKGKTLGSILATLGCILPSLIIIFIISLFYNKYESNKYVQYVFIGVKACVAFLVLKSGIMMFKNFDKKPIWLIVFFAVLVSFSILQVFSIHVSSIFFILGGAVIGLIFYILTNKKKEEIK